MSKKKSSNVGAITRALIQKEEAKQRIDEYNQNPHLCLYCNSPILAPYGKKLYETKRKNFCSHSCASKYKMVNSKFNNTSGKIDNFTDDEIINFFNNSKNISDFSKKLGYKTKIHSNNERINNRLNMLGLSLNDLRGNQEILKFETKGSLFQRYSQWQTARSMIQKDARRVYKLSNKPKKCICCGYNKHFEVAHIKAVSEFEDNTPISEINSENNLIALCPNHHWEYDNTDFNITPYLKSVS
jgi:predicted restriction endonuclease